MQRKTGPKRQHDDKIPKAFDYYTAPENERLTIKDIAKVLDIGMSTVMYLVKADPRYAAWKAQQDNTK